MTAVAYLLLVLSGIWLIGVAVFIVVRPQLALTCLGKMASTNLINYTEISLRMISGLAFLQYADLSRYPQLFYVCGWFLVITSGVLYLIPRKWHAGYAVFWSQKLTPFLLKIAAPFSFMGGVFVIFALH